MKFYELMVGELERHGVEVVFGLIGDTNLSLCGAIADRDSMRLVSARHEGSALTMADGFARASGQMSVCTTTAGPGLVNTGVALTTAARERSRVLVVTGQHSRDDLGNSQWFDHEAFARLCGARYVPIADPANGLESIRKALAMCAEEESTVVLDVAADVQESEYPWPYDPQAEPLERLQPQIAHPDPAAVAAVTDLIDACERPVVLAGRGVARADAATDLAGFADDIGALLATTLLARGMFDWHPFNVGIAGLFSVPDTAELLTEADLIVAVGASLNYYTTEGGYLFPNAKIIHVDVRPPYRMGSGVFADRFIQGDARSVVGELRRSVAGRSGGNPRWRLDEIARRIASTPVDSMPLVREPGLVDPRELWGVVDSELPEKCGMVIGAGHFWGFPMLHMKRHFAPQIFTHQFGSIGQGVATAVGASLASGDRPVVLIDGDGSVAMNVHALEGLADPATRVLAIVLDDGALGAEFHKLEAKGFQPDIARTANIDLAAIARTFGCSATRVGSLAEFSAAVRDFASGSGSLLIDVPTPVAVRSLPYRKLHFAQES